MTTNSSGDHFGIVVSGGPAPGINSVISAATIEAINRGYRVFGLHGGFQALSHGEGTSLQELTIEAVSRIADTGGSILGTSRFNPFFREDTTQAFIQGLAQHGIDKLVVIGGEGSAYLSYQISLRFPHLRVVHVPKTIDNDLVLPDNYPSFGFETARYAGTKILDTLWVDAKTTRRWFLVTSMGRKAGFLALGLGLAAGVTLTIIPEEFEQGLVPASEIADIVFKSVLMRHSRGKDYGVALLAEGLLDRIDPDSDPLLSNCPRDELGRIRYSEIELSDIIMPLLRKRIKEAGLGLSFYAKNLGYELRCHRPISFDIEYTKFLGLGAVRLLLEGHSGVMVTRHFDALSSQPLAAMAQEDGSISSRRVNLQSDLYHVARSYMIR
jgi:6-phosphofructokinase